MESRFERFLETSIQYNIYFFYFLYIMTKKLVFDKMGFCWEKPGLLNFQIAVGVFKELLHD
ncbi:TPA: hypothetical protein DEA21_03315 [Candidatus Uhrbacteria bacterium]|nr:hypothetical protein [Candidatus Uhrbacteria bacterium]HCU32190.1 hypothetical protein [Candidatus Uhrbacteria bacterium]